MRRAAGFTLLAVLFLVTIFGIGMAALGRVWETAARRQKEAQLLFVGEQYQRAIERYYSATPGGAKAYPRRLAELILDPRFPHTVRHLRRLYRDPISGSQEWGLVKDGDAITGVYSLSRDKPLKRAGFAAAYEVFADAASYRDWTFVAFMGKSAAPDGAVQAAAAKATPATQPLPPHPAAGD
jgi:type II secretory pathway pseudopilin PulG